jgi:hypothetical protein
VPDVLLLLPQPGLALEARAWTPPAGDAAGDLPPEFAPLASGEPGRPVLARLPAVPAPRAPVLVAVRAASGEGRYRAVALGPGSGSGQVVLDLLRELEVAGRIEDALLLATAFAHLEPASPGRPEILRAAARLVEAAPAKEKGAGPLGPTPSRDSR